MPIAIIGVGRLGASMVCRLLIQGHECVVYGSQVPNVALDAGDIVVDGCNSQYRDEIRRGGEYGLMAAYAEGFNILCNANVGKQNRVSDAKTTPLRLPEFYQFDLTLPEIAKVWRRGSVIGPWLLDLSAQALQKDPELAVYGGHAWDSGEGRWTIQAAIDEAVPAHVLSAALFDRFSSRGGADFANRILSAMRHEFGGDMEKTGL